jgi:hypothetical protein
VGNGVYTGYEFGKGEVARFGDGGRAAGESTGVPYGEWKGDWLRDKGGINGEFVW